MVTETKTWVWIASGAFVAAIAAILTFGYAPHRKPITIQGAVIVQDTDSRERLPIAGVEITCRTDAVVATGKSDPSGLFKIQLPKSLRRGEAVTLEFRHSGYQPLDLPEFVADKLYVVDMAPAAQTLDRPANQPTTMVGSLRVRYSIKAMTTVNIGSAAKPF